MLALLVALLPPAVPLLVWLSADRRRQAWFSRTQSLVGELPVGSSRRAALESLLENRLIAYTRRVERNDRMRLYRFNRVTVIVGGLGLYLAAVRALELFVAGKSPAASTSVGLLLTVTVLAMCAYLTGHLWPSIWPSRVEPIGGITRRQRAQYRRTNFTSIQKAELLTSKTVPLALAAGTVVLAAEDVTAALDRYLTADHHVCDSDRTPSQ